MTRGIFAALLILTLSAFAFSQELTGNISGRVEDVTHAIVPGVVVTLKSPSLQSERSTTSDDKGMYRFTLIPQGVYSVTFELLGFKTMVREGVEVGVGNTTTLNMQMQLAIVAETVTVTGDSPMVDVRDASVGVNFNSDLLRDIPTTRDIWGVLSETPGITMTSFDVGGSAMGYQKGFQAYGVAGQVLMSVDGVNATEGSGGAGLYMDYSALADVKVSGAANSAEVSVPGAAVTAVVKTGTNNHHGELFADGTNPSFQAVKSNIGFGAKDIDGQIGGPFVHDRFWYFFSFRDTSTGQKTNILSKPLSQGGTPAVYLTLLQNYTLKLNYQLSAGNTLTFSTQAGRKYQPYRGGTLINFLSSYTYESTEIDDSWSEVGKLELTHVIDNHKTLDVSVNNFGYQFPSKSRSAVTPVQDVVSGLQTGAYAVPGVSQQRRWHSNTNFSAYLGRHDMKMGYMLQWYAPRITSYGAPGNGTVGHLLVNTISGIPVSFTTDNGPTWNENIVRQNAVFYQDRIQATSKLTLTLGLRYDRYHSYYPSERFGLNGNKPCEDTGPCALGPFVIPTVTAAKDVARFNPIAPRVAFVYDLFGKTSTAIRGSWGRYSTEPTDIPGLVNPINFITTRYAWDPSILGNDPVAGARLITPAYVATLPIQSGGGQLTPTAVDPHLKDSYTDEYTAGVEHQLLSDLGLHVTWVRKLQHNTYGAIDQLHAFAVFAPIPAIDSGPDGLLKTLDDKRIVVFERMNDATPIDKYLTNQPIGDNYNTIEFGALKRMSNHWMIMTGFDWTKRNLAQPLTVDPNVLLWGATSNAHTAGWTARIGGQHVLSHGWMISGSFQGQNGAPYARSLVIQAANLTAANPARTTLLSQGTQLIYAEPGGKYYLPPVHLTSLSLRKEIGLHDQQKVQLGMSVFNVTNSATVTGVNTSTGRSGSGTTSVATFGQSTAKMSPRTARFSVRYVF